MKTLKNLLLSLFVIASIGSMAQNEIKMHTGSVNIGEGKTYYFFDSGGEEEFTVAEDPNNDYRWKTWYNHNEVYTLTFKVPENSTKGIKVTFRSLLINNDHLIIYEGNPGDSLDMSKRIVDLTNNDYSTDYSTFTVMSHGNMNIRFRADGHWRDAGWEAEVKLDDFDPQAPIVMRKACDNQLVILPTCNGCSIYYNMSTGTPTDPTNASTSYTIGNTIDALTTYPFTMKAIAYIDNVASGIGSQTITSEIAAPVFTNTANTDYEAYYTYNPTDKTNTITINTNRDPNINDTYYARYIINDTADHNNCTYSITHSDKYQEMENPGGTIDYTNTTLTPDFYVHMLIRGTTCPDKFSAIKTVTVEHIYIPKPEIVFESTGDTIKCNFAGATICYTTDGSNPTAMSSSEQVQAHYYTEEGSNEQKIDYYYITIDHVTAGTTVKAMAIKTNYQPSDIASAIYSTGSGVVEGTSIVLIDDREDHSWSYYSDKDNPIRSLNPADVKITYYGNGKMYTSTTATPSGDLSDATGVKVSATESENTFIYLKTLERANGDAGTGNLAYTLIPNPFTVRPTFTSGNNPYYTGFYGWRVKNLNGVTISGYNKGSIIPAETEIQFVTDKSEGNEVEFEAVWARAYVVTSNTTNGLQASVGYERNFVYLSSNTTLRDGALSVPVTYTTLDPATGNGTKRTITIRDNFTCEANTKFENVTLAQYNNNSQTFTANNHDLIFGRGVGGTVNMVRGAGGNLSNPNFHIRLESGTVNYVSMLNGYYYGANSSTGTGNTHSGLVNIKATIGSDYDRATDETSGPNIANSMIYGVSTTISSTDNRTRKTLDVVVKSGKIGSSHTINSSTTADVYQSLYMSVAGAHTNVGERSLTIEGGEISNIAGGIDGLNQATGTNQGTPNAWADNGVRSLTVRMKGGTVRGAFYGGAAKSPASGDRHMVFTGGTIKSWLGAGCNGTDDDGGQTYGESFVYVGGKTHVGGGNTINGSEPGVVFGAGKGYAGGTGTSGEMSYGTNIVVADEVVIENDVYGGGNYGYAKVNTNLYILGGTIKGDAFGGSNRKQGDVVNVYMQNGTVEGSVYGGSNTTGTVAGPVAVNITGGQVKGNVHGGGYGQNTNVAGNVEVTIGGTNPQDTPTIAGDVYGGGALGKVNTTASNTTHVTVNAGTMNNVYGGGLGQGQSTSAYDVYISWGNYSNYYTFTYEYVSESGETKNSGNLTTSGNTTVRVKANSTIKLTTSIGSNNYRIIARYNDGNGSIIAQTSRNNTIVTAIVDGRDAGNTAIAANVGTVTVDINGGNMINVFGCNNLNGAPQGSVNVNFNGGEAVNVYGGGNLADYLPNTTLFPTVNITGGKVTNSVYGGGAFAKVNKTIVNMTGGEAGSVYAGAQGDDKNKKLVNYNKTVNMQGGTAIMVYGGSFTCLDSAKSFVNISGGRVKTNVFGSGYFGDMKGDCYVYIGKNAITSAPHSGENGDKFTTTLSDEKPIWIESNVYAGANWGSFQGTFGEATITGASNIYIDGTGYNMDHGKTGNYMIIGGSVYGSGTSCAAGTTDHSIIVRKYGNMTYPSMTRSLRSIQRASNLILDESNIDFTGQGDISSMDPTVEYGICNIETIYATNVNNMALSKPLDMVKKLGSYTCENVYTTTPTNDNTYSTPKNGIVINNGGYLMVRYDTIVNNEPKKYYGELKGFFYMREPGDDAGINNEGYIFARPKLIPENGESLIEKENDTYSVFATDGGFVDFDATESDWGRNLFDERGNKVKEKQQKDATLGDPVQMPYSNRTTAPEADRTTPAQNNTDYRFWRFDPDTVPTVTREVVFVVKADEDAGDTTTKFLTTTGSVQLPPALSETNKYYITGLTWGADGKDCNPANITKTGADEDNREWKYYDEGFKNTTDSNANNSIAEYFANPNSTFGFLMRFGGNLKTQDPMILDNNSFQNYFNEHALAEVGGTHTTELPELDFLVTYSDRLSQNEMWAEARMIIEERDATGKLVQKIYLNISVTTITKFGQDVETYVYASTAGDRVSTYTAQLNLPTFALDDNTKFYATFKAAEATKTDDFGKVGETTVVTLANYDEDIVKTTTKLALQFSAASNEDNTNGWYHKGDAQNPNQPVYFDFNKVLNGNTPNDSVVGASDGRKYTTIAFDLLYDPTALKNVSAFGIGQKHVGDLFIKMVVDNIEGGINTFNITVHVYVTGPTKYYYLDGVAGKDGNSGMFPDKAKKTLNGVLNASGYTSSDPIFVVNGVEPKSGATLTWNADKFLNSVTVPEEDKNKYTEEELIELNRLLSQVKVYRYPGSHPKEDGDTNSVTGVFYNGMYTGQMVNVPAGTQFAMHNVCLSGGSDLDTNSLYNPNKAESPTLHADHPLISIAAGATATIENSSLMYNNNTSTTAIAGAIYNEGDLTVDGVNINNNVSVAESGKGAGVYQAGTMKLGNTAAIIIADQVYLDDQKIMEAPNGLLYNGSKFSDILVYCDKEPIDTSYSGRVIVRYSGAEPSAPKAPYWKANLPERQSSILKSRKDASEESYESDKYLLNSTLSGFEKANGGDENVIPFITYKMKEQFDPISSSDIIMYTNQANLPVELLYFTAECMGEATQLQWSTASETNNEYFTIERSSDAVNYEEVARIQGAGTTSQRSDYSFMVDNNSNAITYYRLRQTDIDGKYEIFAPIAIQCQNNKAATEISIYPVPANDQVNIFSSNSPMTRIEIYSIMGAKVAEEPAEGNQTTLHIGNLATGVYAVKVFTEDGQVSNVRLIKK